MEKDRLYKMITQKHYGFKEVHYIGPTDSYKGNADVVLLVWNAGQILPAEQYRKANYPDKIVDIAVCHKPNVIKKEIGEKGVIYNKSSGGGGSGSG